MIPPVGLARHSVGAGDTKIKKWTHSKHSFMELLMGRGLQGKAGTLFQERICYYKLRKGTPLVKKQIQNTRT